MISVLIEVRIPTHSIRFVSVIKNNRIKVLISAVLHVMMLILREEFNIYLVPPIYQALCKMLYVYNLV